MVNGNPLGSDYGSNRRVTPVKKAKTGRFGLPASSDSFVVAGCGAWASRSCCHIVI